MASIFVQDGILYLNARLENKQFRRSTGLVDTKANRLIVQQELLPKFLDEIKNPDEKVKLQYYIDKFLLEKQFALKERTFYRYKKIIEQWISPKYAHKLVGDIKTSHLKEYLNHQFSLGKSAKSVELYRTVFSGLLQEALYDNVIRHNPFINIKRQRVKRPKLTPFAAAEVRMLLDESSGWLKNYIALATYTGLRSGEIIGLKWIDIDDECISIRRTRDFNKDTAPKTLSSIRDVPLFEGLKPYLMDQKHKTGHLEYVFVKSDGEPWGDTQNIAQGYWYPLLDRVGLKRRSLYEMRHTFATNMLNSGKYRVADIAQMLGHTTTEYLFNVYSQYIEAERKKVDFKVDLYKISRK